MKIDEEDKVLNTIKSGDVKMRPHGYFVARTVLRAILVLLFFLLLLFVITFILFVLQENGGFYAANFGPVGWGVFLESLPWVTFLLSLALLMVLWLLVQRYSIAYHQPLLYTLLILIFVASITAIYLIPVSYLQGGIFRYVSRNQMPMVTGIYTSEIAPADGVYRGQIVALSTSSFILAYAAGQTSTVFLAPTVASSEFKVINPGDYVIIFGRRVATGTIEASGMEKIVDYQ
jgi:hypothetical protein